MAPLPLDASIPMLAVYSVCFALQFCELIRDNMNQEVAFQRRNRNLIFGLVLLMFAVRIAWSAILIYEAVFHPGMQSPPSWQVQYVLNRLALLIWGTVQLEVAFVWLRFTRRADQRISNQRVLVLLADFLLWGSQIVLFLLNLSTPSHFDCMASNEYDVGSVVSIAIAELCVSLCFLAFVVCLQMRPPTEKCAEYNWSRATIGFKASLMPRRSSLLTILCAIIISFLAIVRAFLFSFGILTCITFPEPLGSFLYPWMFYVIPDVLGIACMLAATQRTILSDAFRRFQRYREQRAQSANSVPLLDNPTLIQ